ncbi:hypothetical protein [uncultured Methanobrevibacter sp.]|uniref:hypothetical protein n=1 Tax=uncultured Methanobrevibacter sp. TaxID=253161 RepID=UPI0025EECCF0|nr:hypothetical protein [uncultured Methanobrevibacter sp.]
MLDNSKQSRWTMPANAIISYSNEGMRISAQSWADLYLNNPINKPCIIEWEIGAYSYMLFNLYLWDTNKSTRYLNCYEFSSGSSGNMFVLDVYNSSSNYINYKPNVGDIIKLEVDNTECRAYVNDVLIITKNYTHITPFLLGIATSSDRYETMKNLKIKAL